MATLPQLIEEDIQAMNRALDQLLARSEACAALIIDKGGFLITQTVNARQFDLVTLAALSAASFAATQGIANLVSESNFTSIYQQGEIHSLLVINIDEHCLLTVVFPAQVSVGAVKYFAAATVKEVANQLKKASQRNPTARLDLSLINIAETGPLFRKKTA